MILPNLHIWSAKLLRKNEKSKLYELFLLIINVNMSRNEAKTLPAASISNRKKKISWYVLFLAE